MDFAFFTRKNKKNNKNKHSFTQVNPIKARQNERKRQQEAKKELNRIAKNLEKLFGGRRTRKRKHSHKFMHRK